MIKIKLKHNSLYLFSVLFSLLLLFDGCSSTNSDTKETNYITNNTQKILVIQINYNNVQQTQPATYWSDKIFKNQLNIFYKENFNNDFRVIPVKENQGIDNDGIITISLNKNHPNPDSASSPELEEDIKTIMSLADKYVTEKLNTNNDNYITPKELTVLFIFPGHEASYYNTEEPNIWAHSTQFSNIYFQNKYLKSHYGLISDMQGTHNATVGIIAHELGHAIFDLPDLYSTIDTNNKGIGYFGLMSYGSWNSQVLQTNSYEGNSPAHFMAWSRLQTGIEANNLITINKNTNKNYEVYGAITNKQNILKIPVNDNEYYLIENYGVDGFEKGYYSRISNYKGGNMLWHIDKGVITQNKASNTVQGDVSHKGVDIVEADNNNVVDNNGNGLGTNLFYKGNVDFINDYTLPSLKTYDNQKTNIEIQFLSNPNSKMTVNIKR